MKFFSIGEYHFSYFDNAHITSMITLIIIGIVIILLPYIFKGLEKGRFTTGLGYFLIFLKIFDSIYRIVVEKHPWYETIPLNLCNMSIIFAGLYFITRKRIYFNFLYFWFSGAILAILLPDLKLYYHPIYPYVFMATHVLEVIAVFYGFIHLDERITLKGVYSAAIGYLTLVFLGAIWNNIFGTNFMFVNNYIIPAVNFIKPFGLYVIVLLTLFELSIFLMYLPFAKNQKEDFEEKII